MLRRRSQPEPSQSVSRVRFRRKPVRSRQEIIRREVAGIRRQATREVDS
ncbi:hypothetical protein LINGRAHAP2_LOCUS26161 [Linum grandiflorum]